MAYRWLLKWLLTLLVAVIFISRIQSPHNIAAIAMLIAFFWTKSVLIVLGGAPPPFPNYREFHHFVQRLLELRLWGSTTTILILGLLVRTFFSEEVIRFIAWSYMICCTCDYGWLYVLSFIATQY